MGTLYSRIKRAKKSRPSRNRNNPEFFETISNFSNNSRSNKRDVSPTVVVSQRPAFSNLQRSGVIVAGRQAKVDARKITLATLSNEPKEKNVKIECITCSSTLNENHLGIKCLQSHVICPECAQNYISTIFADPIQNLPPKCPICRTEIVGQTLEIQFDSYKSTQYNNLMLCIASAQSFSPNEAILHCSFCSYSEIRDKMGVNFVFCQNDKCKKRSCFYCHLECPYQTDNETRNRITFKENEDENFEDPEARKHFICADLFEMKSKIERAIEDGSKVKCPKCGTSGRKDNNCTHMTCVKCNSSFCYFCGLSVEVCDKDSEINTIYGHNVEWPTNEKRCPMFLTEIVDVDEKWPSGDEYSSSIDDECLNYFHKLKILSLLRLVFQTNSREEIERVEKKYHCIENSNLTVDDILNKDLTLINRN